MELCEWHARVSPFQSHSFETKFATNLPVFTTSSRPHANVNEVYLTLATSNSRIDKHRTVLEKAGIKTEVSGRRLGAFLAAAVWGGQWGGHIFIGGARISDDNG